MTEELIDIPFRRRKTDQHLVVEVNLRWYCVPWYCLVDLLWGMPESFYPCDKLEWADHPLYFTTCDMLEHAITRDIKKFEAFKLYRPIRGRWVPVKCTWEIRYEFD